MKLQTFLLIAFSLLLAVALPTTGDTKFMQRAYYFDRTLKSVACTDESSQVVSQPINWRQCIYDANNPSDPENCPSELSSMTCWEQDGEEIRYETGGSWSSYDYDYWWTLEMVV